MRGQVSLSKQPKKYRIN